MSTVIERNQKPRAVKNLDWLLRNWQRVEKLGFNYHPDTKRMIDGQLVAYLRNGGVYLTDFADLSVCWRFLNRPVFKGVKFYFANGFDESPTEFTIGDAKYLTAQGDIPSLITGGAK